MEMERTKVGDIRGDDCRTKIVLWNIWSDRSIRLGAVERGLTQMKVPIAVL